MHEFQVIGDRWADVIKPSSSNCITFIPVSAGAKITKVTQEIPQL